MAIKRNRVRPVIQIDCVVSGIERPLKAVYENGKPTGELEDKGRELSLVTAKDSPDLVLKVGLDHDDAVFEVGKRYLVNVEYSEFDGNNGTIATMTFHSFVEPGQFDAWKGVVAAQTPKQQQNA